ncbi:class III lanthionine synthetase LanKC [Symbioplanes lichenis]|uniref:class III lanthionine synthetase LanKC n=1 Tax=Symbioplanes lichenis TaxID=1629072 RepID=UPI00273858F5|nr:class III lanthionine synthetase LanKC [Actinoplanes lichenis]
MHDDYCLPGRPFFDRADGDDDSFAAVAPRPGPEWTVRSHGPWRMLHRAGTALPEQGWKVHVAATPGNAARTLGVVHDFCAGRQLTYKHLRSPRALLHRNGKYAARGTSGKFVTVYPADEEALGDVLDALGRRLHGSPGPYILGDLRIGPGPLHVRYGGFVPLEVDDGGRATPAIRRPDGVLVPDRRTAAFHVPPWVTPPAVLAPHLAARRPADLPFRITGALHFSNGGGVYHALSEGGRRILVKEARPHAGLDGHGRDAVVRLRREHEALVALAGIPGLPEVHGLHEAWEHLFLAREFRDGIPLGKWMARACPLYDDATPDALSRYYGRAAGLADQLDRLLARVHDRGWVFGDLHPRNVLVDDQDRISLIDAEAAFPVTEDTVPGLGAPGFTAPPGTRGFDLDRYALAALRLWLLVPLAPMREIAPESTAKHLDWAAGRFPVPPATVARLRRDLMRSGPRPRPRSGETAIGDLVRAIHASATPDRADRLFPGDVEQFRSGGLGLGHGAAGVLHALAEAGDPPRPEYVDWLCRRAAAEPARPGLWTGSHGVATVLDRLGQPAAADALLARCDRPPSGISLADGVTGVALALLTLARRRRTPLDAVRTLAGTLTTQPPASTDATGLLHGWSGPALLFTRLYEATGDASWLDHAETALGRDLARCVATPDGGLQVPDKGRVLPYLESGSAGIAVAAAALSAHRPVAALPELLRACRPSFVVYPGLMNGRAGLIAALAATDPAAAAAHVPGLDLHAVPYGGGTACPGVTLRRLSMDLHTGTAGVLLALARLAARPGPTAAPGADPRVRAVPI